MTEKNKNLFYLETESGKMRREAIIYQQSGKHKNYGNYWQLFIKQLDKFLDNTIIWNLWDKMLFLFQWMNECFNDTPAQK